MRMQERLLKEIKDTVENYDDKLELLNEPQYANTGRIGALSAGEPLPKYWLTYSFNDSYATFKDSKGTRVVAYIDYDNQPSAPRGTQKVCAYLCEGAIGA